MTGGRRTAIYLRTHLWDEATDLCYRRLSAAAGGGVTVMADMTRPFTVPPGIQVLEHRLSDFPARGLPLRPSPEKALWLNGDYAFYLLAEADPADFFLMLDGDCCVNGLDLAGLIARLEAENVDFCAPYVSECGPDDWTYWAGLQRAWFDEELGPGHGAKVVKSFFPIVFMSRRAVLHLYDRRREMARAKEAGLKAQWPQCESVAPSEVARMPNPIIRNLGDLAVGPMHMTYYYPLGVEEALESDKRLIHPLLSGARLGKKILGSVAERLAKDRHAQVAELRKALLRPLEADALDVLQEGLEALMA
ncbi:hypothetical protein NX862_09400 [Rhodobacter sp. KR11]|jgi:hypothetical protein|uniref:hypothetical protein n=1 Tax=Rhodobacter sp. KR11 TaxID=2974588 RepID=UPI00222268C8|nr:hypothetical protein [Rhodobacter sp. KR11]MCW1918971.1 hypothetical protein [Rhodobacter sp. KR11]